MQLIHGDCRKEIKNIETGSVQLILTDPPYGGIINEAWDTSNLVVKDLLVAEFRRVLKEDGSVYVWCGIGEKSQSLIDFYLIFRKYFWFKDLITWKKRRGIGMRKGWLYAREEILWFTKKRKDFVWNKAWQYGDDKNIFKQGMSGTKVHEFKRIPNVWTDIPEKLVNMHKHHPTEKPLEALERIILVHTSLNDLVLDPFMGGGSTGKVAISLGREFIGIEQNLAYFTVAKEWLENAEN